MSQELQTIFPSAPPVAEILINHHLSQAFRREVESRQEHQRYCDWYRQLAHQHQRELENMRGDINLFGWFLRGRS